jgi:serine/threonine protein kinase
MTGAGQSRRLARVAWSATSNDEETRSYLQSRLMTLSALMFWSFVVFLGGLSVMYASYPTIEPAWNRVIFLSSTVGLVMLAGIWRLALARRPLTMAQLNLIDMAYAGGTGLLFGLGGYLATDFRPAPYATLLYACLTVLSRAIVVPSTPKRTLVMAGLSFGPFMLAAVVISFRADVLALLGMPGPALVLSVLVICASTALLAATGSHTTYGLRVKASAAMQLGQYTLDRKIGSGGMGDVYVAHHVLLRRATAIKLLQPDRVGAENLDRFEQEVHHISQLSHPNTVTLFDYGRNPEGVFYYAMEYLDGLNLQQLVEREGGLPARRVAEILAQVCGSLQEAHGRDVIHRDIKPANIILCERGGMPDVAKVVDFGLAKPVEPESGDAHQQAVAGTPGYLAPEVASIVVDRAEGRPRSAGPIRAPSDIYALGAVGYFLLVGKRLFDGDNAIDVCRKHATEAPTPLAEVANAPDQLATLIMACLAKEPAARPSAEALAKALRAIDCDDWDEARARGWWLDFRRKQRLVPTPNDTTLSITVDLGQRLQG